MKNFLKISLIAVFFLTSAGSFAAEGDFLLKVSGVDKKMVTFFINEPQAVSVLIYGSDDEILYEKEIKVSQASKKIYDLSSFPDGSYTFKMTTASKYTEYKVLIANGETTVSKPVIVEAPVLTKEQEVITLNFSSPVDGTVEVDVLNDNNDLIYTRVFEGGPEFRKKFNIAKLDNKAVTFIIRSDAHEFMKTVQLN